MNYRIFAVIFAASFVFTSCSKYQRLLKSTDYEEKYLMALSYYEQKDFDRAIQLFDQLVPYYRGTDRAERISYLYAYAHYYQQDYVMASFYFKRFAKTFPKSANAEEAAFMSAYCQYLDSPRHTLDQTNTHEAIKELQLFINQYPQSSRIDECNRLIDNLRKKLELKELEIARLYFKMELYVAAVTAFENLLKNFPNTRYREEIMMNILKANYYYAMNSIIEKKKERLSVVLASYDNFSAQFPESPFMKEARTLQRNALQELNLLNK